jgi:hypothetical protein
MNDALQPPIIVVDDSGHPELYPTLDAAILDLEGIDVQEGIYRVFDSVGRRITLRAEGVQRGWVSIDIGTVHFDHADQVPTAADELRKLLIDHLAYLNVSCESHIDLPTLVRLVQERHQQ